MKRDAQKALLAAAGRYIRRMFGEVEPRIKAIEQAQAENAELKTRIETLEKALAERPLPERGEKGDPGEQGVPGRDAEPVLVADVVRELIDCADLRPILDLLAAEAVEKHLGEHPPKDGRDGEPGTQGPAGERGADGKDGADGIGLAGAVIDREGQLVVTLTNGEQKSLGPVVGRDGANGRDGLSVSEVSRTYDGETHEVVERWTADGEQKELRYPAGGIRPGGFYREGMKCHALQAVTHDGALWIAKRDTTAKPCLENADDWQLAARKGRDGRDGRDGKIPEPVKLKVPADG